MNILEHFYIQYLHQNGTLIQEQQGEQNILSKIINPTTPATHAQKPRTS
jgi:hypothetical protein